jgi:N-acyl-D-amino-acid deacylase
MGTVADKLTILQCRFRFALRWYGTMGQRTRRGVSMIDLIIRGGTIFDGTGAVGFRADVAVKNGYIVEIQDHVDHEAALAIDARGLAVTPGFIDMHSHADCSVPMWPDMESALGQGITTCFAGHCGMGVAPIPSLWLEQCFEGRAFNKLIPQVSGGPMPGKGRVLAVEVLRSAFEEVYDQPLDWRSFGEYLAHLERTGHGANLAICVGHNQLRQQILGHDAARAATPEEVKQMESELTRALDEGAFGVSFGFDYYSGMYAEENEVVALMRVASERNAVVAAHMRRGPRPGARVGPSHPLLAGFTEFLELGLRTGARIHVSHVYPAFQVANERNSDILGKAAAYSSLELVERYRRQGLQATWDYLGLNPAACFFFPQLATRFRPYVDDCGGKTAFARALGNEWYRTAIAREIRDGNHRAASPIAYLNRKAGEKWGADLVITRCEERAFEGRTIEAIAAETGLDCVETAIEIMRRDPETLCDRKRDVDPVEGHVFVQDQEMSFGIDNGAHNYDFIEQDGPDLPYVKGTPTEFGGMVEYFRTFKELPFEALIKRMTGNAAKALRLSDRGFVHEGMRADLLVIDRENLKSNLNPAEPPTAPDGIVWVLVNGTVAVENKRHLRPRTGTVIRRN